MQFENSLSLKHIDPESKIRVVPSRPDAPTQVEENCVKVLNDHLIEISEAEIMAMLDYWPKSQKILAAVIDRPFLTEVVILRVATLASDILLDRLAGRHALPSRFRREITKRSRFRPGWWQGALLRSPS